MEWTDVAAIAEALVETHPDVDPAAVRFIDPDNRVVALDGFDDDRTRGGERVPEAIQAAWINETT